MQLLIFQVLFFRGGSLAGRVTKTYAKREPHGQAKLSTCGQPGFSA